MNKFVLPDPELSKNMIELLQSEEFADLDVHFESSSSIIPIRLHRSILHARSRSLLDYLAHNPVKSLDIDEFRLVIEFIYSGRFDFDSFERLIETRKLNESTGNNEWVLVPNKLIRFANQFGLAELAELILDHLVGNYLNLNTFSAILTDACRVSEPIEAVRVQCLEFVRNNLENTIKNGCFDLLSKEILLDIIKNCII